MAEKTLADILDDDDEHARLVRRRESIFKLIILGFVTVMAVCLIYILVEIANAENAADAARAAAVSASERALASRKSNAETCRYIIATFPYHRWEAACAQAVSSRGPSVGTTRRLDQTVQQCFVPTIPQPCIDGLQQ